MSRQPRAGEAGKQRSFRATEAEWSAWTRASETAGFATLSAAIVKVMNQWATRVTAPRRKHAPKIPKIP
jgi:hypothetical protein